MTEAELREKNLFRYTALIVGGLGPDQWDMELTPILAKDIREACTQAVERAEEVNGWVVSVSQDD